VLRERQSEDLRGCGLSLIGYLLKGCLDRQILPQLSMRADDLIMNDGRVVGVRFKGPNGATTESPADAVVLATGGFEWNPQLVRAFLRGPMSTPVSLPNCTGDGLLMAMRAGASLGNMREAWWIPCSYIPTVDGNSFRPYLINRERTLPGSIMVNRAGQRFANEAASYNAIGGAFHVLDTANFGYPNLPAWLVFDHAYIRKYGFAHLAPTDAAPHWLASADSLTELARQIGIDVRGINKTVKRWNHHIEFLSDPDFHRGRSVYDSWAGDADHRKSPAGTLGPISQPPFYAIEVFSARVNPAFVT
jgi:3-oxosteroid 1-dehydrogenase